MCSLPALRGYPLSPSPIHVTAFSIDKTCVRQNAERADLNGDNLRVSMAYLRISDHCRVRVWVRVRS